MKSAVLVIDMQQGLCEEEGAFDCPAVITRINDVTHKARLAKTPVIFVQHQSDAGYLEKNTTEWQLADGLEVTVSDLKLNKTTPDAFLRTNLRELLNSLEVEKLFICGMHSEFCVDTTTRRALSLGFPVILISDAHTSAGNKAISAQQVIAHENETLTNISSFGPRAITISSAEINF